MSRTDHHLRNSATPPRGWNAEYLHGIMHMIVSKPVLGKRAHIAAELAAEHDCAHHVGHKLSLADSIARSYRAHAEPVYDLDTLAPWELELLACNDSVYATREEMFDTLDLNVPAPADTSTRTSFWNAIPKGHTMTRTKTTIEFAGLNAATYAQILIERDRNRQATASRRDIDDARRNKAGMRHAYVTPGK